jgi:ABC-2 type transport system ATP-binding protein
VLSYTDQLTISVIADRGHLPRPANLHHRPDNVRREPCSRIHQVVDAATRPAVDLNVASAGDAQVMAVIEVNEVRKRYCETIALDGVDLRVDDGEIFGIVGPNGAGKTTLVECLSGLRRPDTGQVRVFGRDPWRHRRTLRQHIGVQLQKAELPDALQVWEALDLYASFYKRPADIGRLLADWGLVDKRNTRFSRLSGGQKQRLFIALALVGDPRLAILDELTAGLDPQARRYTWDAVRAIRGRGVTVVLVTHYMDEVERLCDRVALMRQGRILMVDTPAGLVARTGVATLEDAVLTVGGSTP